MVRLVSSFAFAILLLATLGDAYTHKFHVYGRIVCPKEKFWYKIKLDELDVTSPHDIIGEAYKDSVYPHYYNHTFTAEHGDAWTNYYEPRLSFTHSCTPNGRPMKKIYATLEKYIHEKDWTYDMPMDVNLYKGSEKLTNTPL